MVDKAEKRTNLISSFIIDLNDLTKDDLWNIILYLSTPANNGEKWELEIAEKYHWVSGYARGEDTGKFYHFLVSKSLDKKIEIVRGP